MSFRWQRGAFSTEKHHHLLQSLKRLSPVLGTAVQKFPPRKRGAKNTAKDELGLSERHEGKKYRTLPAGVTQTTAHSSII